MLWKHLLHLGLVVGVGSIVKKQRNTGLNSKSWVDEQTDKNDIYFINCLYQVYTKNI